MTGPRKNMTLRLALAIWVAFTLLYGFFNYGGIRSPDIEVIFRVAQSLAAHGDFEVRECLPWKEHGVTRGPDGKNYSLYGPMHSLLFVPMILATEALELDQGDPNAFVPPSQYVDNGVLYFMQKTAPPDPTPHRLRFIASFLNPLLAALTVLLLFLCLHAMRLPNSVATAGALAFGLGTLWWPYAGTAFSEVPATFFALASFTCLVRRDRTFTRRIPRKLSGCFALSGLLIGLAFAVHITAAFFVPFIGLYALYIAVTATPRLLRVLRPCLFWLSGFAVGFGLWGITNAMRFGSFFETGRTVTAEQAKVYAHGGLTAPWQGIFGLLFSSGRGLVWYAPLALLALGGFRVLLRRHPALSVILAAMMLTRFFVCSSLVFWHGGFALGPRYLVMLLPFVFIPAAVWLTEQRTAERSWSWYLVTLAVVAASVQQLYFALGEIFTFYHTLVYNASRVGVSLLAHNRLYLDWDFTPLTQLHNIPPAPFWAQPLDLPMLTLWIIAAPLTGAAVATIFTWLWRRRRSLDTQEPL